MRLVEYKLVVLSVNINNFFELCIFLVSFMIFFLEVILVILEFNVFDHIRLIIFECLHILAYRRAFF